MHRDRFIDSIEYNFRYVEVFKHARVATLAHCRILTKQMRCMECDKRMDMRIGKELVDEVERCWVLVIFCLILHGQRGPIQHWIKKYMSQSKFLLVQPEGELSCDRFTKVYYYAEHKFGLLFFYNLWLDVFIDKTQEKMSTGDLNQEWEDFLLGRWLYKLIKIPSWVLFVRLPEESLLSFWCSGGSK